jgi:hypothetical protein
VEAVFVGLLLAAVALAWSEQHMALWANRSANSAASGPISQPARNPACPDYSFDAMGADYQGGAVVTAC